ncbi:CPBP family intramembrane glutamic endopeptidase [Duganella sp. HH105]|uniref:CPBP family intramembrane glutamic endopeptidase n=1 Tax=Duganella sp. HH105 TaxID=1781067 RepID=UPI0008940D05|nr:CPBP family intramembrane glutamic endopeptidase [Duganella sp. HH105]OEZ57688.1 CAAX amino terminal protease self- immunity [Duganella sp. HH105]
MENQVYRPRLRNMWLGLLAGSAAVMFLGLIHLYLMELRYPPGATPLERFNDHSDTALWLWLQLLDLAGGAAAGVLVARWSPRASWRALALMVAGALVYTVFAELPHTGSALRRTIWHLAVALGVLCGGLLYRWRERGGTQALERAVPADHGPDVPHTPVRQALLVMAICFGSFIVYSLSMASGGFGVPGFSDRAFAGVIAQELLSACVALALLRQGGYPLATLLPRPSWGGLGVGVVLYAAACMASTVAGLLFGEQPVGERMAPSHITLYGLLPLALVNGAFEDVFLLAYLQRGLRRFGASNAIGIVMLVRLLCHWYQGPAGAAGVLAMGLVFSIYYARTGRLFPVIAAHVVAGLLPFLSTLN